LWQHAPMVLGQPRFSRSDPAPASLHVDERWPRAGHWLAAGPGEHRIDLAVLGVPTFASSPGSSGAHATPSAVRRALHHYTTWCESRRVDIADLWPWDVGDVTDPDLEDGDWRIRASVKTALAKARLLVVLGGDGALTAPVVLGGYDLERVGIVSVDAQHDVREGHTSGSSLRTLLDAGLPPRHLVHLGASDWATSRSYAAELRALGVHLVGRDVVEHSGAVESMRSALDLAAADPRGIDRQVHVSIDLAVCDRAAAPGSINSVPGGLSARQLLAIAFAAGLDTRVRSVDLVEVDAASDESDQRTVRLVALLLLEIAAGIALRTAGT
jgi:formiminoglutamase